MGKGVLAAIVVIGALGASGPAYAADADVYARETTNGLCFSADPASPCPAGEAANVTIAPGESVTWHFDGSTMGHNAADSEHGMSPEWAVPDHFVFVTSGDYPHQFTSEGTYDFFCEAHQQMKGTVTVGTPPDEDPPPDDDPPSSPPPTGGTHPTTPAPTPEPDSVKPKVRSVKLKALRRAVRVRFRLSEPATVTVKVKRGRKVVKAKRVQAGKGLHSVTVRSKKLKKGRYTVEILARDASGNRSRLATKRLSVRR